MADETKNLSGEGSDQSNSFPSEASPLTAQNKDPSPQPPALPQNQIRLEDQAHIVEEIIVKPAPEKTISAGPQAALSAEDPMAALSASPVLEKSQQPAPFVIPKATPLTSAALSAKMEVKLPELSSSPPPTSPREPTSEKLENQALAQPHISEMLEKESEAIVKILEEAKLPERHTLPEAPAAAMAASKVFDTALGAEAKHEKEKSLEIRPKSEAETSTAEKSSSSILMSSIVMPLRTLKNDLQNIIRIKKISLVRAAAIESDKKSSANIFRGEMEHTRSRRARAIIFASGLLVFLGVAGLFGVYFISQEHAGIPSIPQSGSILFAESTVALPLKNNSPLEIKRTIVAARGGINATLGSITRIVPTVSDISPDGKAIERPATLEEFLATLGTRASPDLIRALSSEFFFGLHTVDKNAPLLVIPVLSYERAFAGMLDWEQTLNDDLAPAFTAVPDQVIGTGGLPEKRRFNDVVMRNYDVRALIDDAGAIQLYYSFPTQHLLIIAESPYSFAEILNRLRAERKL